MERKVKSAKKKLRKEGEDDAVPEDDPMRMAMSVKVMIGRMFAEFEARKKQLDEKDAEAKAAAAAEDAEKPLDEGGESGEGGGGDSADKGGSKAAPDPAVETPSW